MTPDPRRPLPVTIRSRLLLLVLSVLLPGALGVAWLIATTLASEREANTRALRESARALSKVVDREITKRVAVAHVLTQSRWLDGAPEVSPEHLLNFEQLARRSLQGMAGWIELRGPGRVLLTRGAPQAARRGKLPRRHPRCLSNWSTCRKCSRCRVPALAPRTRRTPL